MSRTRVVEGVDERGRPRTRWSEPVAPVAAYGFMEPAYASVIERRQASPDELAAARAREADPDPLRAAPLLVKAGLSQGDAAARLQQSRMNGAARHVEVMAAKAPHQPEPSPEEETVAEAGQILTTESPATEKATPVEDPFVALSGAALTAQYAREQLAIATAAWDIACAALTDAMAAAYEAIESDEPVADPADDDHVHHVLTIPLSKAPTNIPETIPASVAEPIGGGPVEDRLTTHERRVLEAAVRLDGDRKATARELGLTAAINVEQALERIAKKGLLPIALIPKLPARFSKYTGV